MNTNNTVSTSVLKGRAIYGDLLLKQGYKRYQVDDLAISEFLAYERQQTGEPAELYLLAIKKILLYAIPVVAPTNIPSKRGVPLTAQFSSDCIVNNQSKDVRRLIAGDKYTLLGLAFPRKLINNLDFNTFEWKYYYQYPKDYIMHGIDISHLDGVEVVTLPKGRKQPDGPDCMYMIKSSHFEDVSLYNQILHQLMLKLNEYTDTWTSILNQVDESTHRDEVEFATPDRIKPLNDTSIISKLNQVLEKQIDPTYTISYYETLQSTNNWLLYNHIWLYGYDSPQVSSYLARLSYIKSENRKVFIGLTKETQHRLLQTRAEKICREQYPYYFSTIDRRGIFTKFNRFNLSKLPKAHQNEINILLEKELAHQSALINNKCPHMPLTKTLLMSTSAVDIVRAYNDVLPFIDMDRKRADQHTYHCKNCSYELLCEHEVEFYSEIKMSKEDPLDKAESDILYEAQQIIVNQFKQTQIAIDPADIFSYHCKYCAKELGKSGDIIQVSRMQQWSQVPVSPQVDMYKNIANTMLFTVLTNHVDPLVLGIDKKRVIRSLGPTIREHLEDVSYAFRKLKDETIIDQHTKLSGLVLSLCALIALNINVLKTNKQLLIEIKSKWVGHKEPTKRPSEVEKPEQTAEEPEPITDDSSSDEEQPAVTGGSIKTEFAAAFAIVKNSPQVKNIAIGDDKLRSMLLDYYRRVAKDIGEVIDVTTITRTNEERLSNEISQSPVYAYLKHIVARNAHSTVGKPSFKQVMGLEITKGIHGNLYEHVPEDKVKPTSDMSKYIHESYKNVREFLASGKYIGSEISPELSEFVRSYEKAQYRRIYQLMHNPKYIMDERNAREVSFKLENLNLIYCDSTDTITKHKWVKGSCSVCKITMGKVSQAHNKSIVEQIDNEIAKDALFDLYTNSCPVKDIHVYADESVGLDSKCTQCSVTKRRLLDQDPKYYKQYLPQFNAHRKRQITTLVAKVNELTAAKQHVARTMPKDDTPSGSESDLDAPIDQMTLNLSKIFEISTDDLNTLSTTFLDSYIRLVYERYTYASNLSYDMAKHPDIEFYDLIKAKFFKGFKPIPMELKRMPQFNYEQASTKTKRFQLLTLLTTIIQNESDGTMVLARFLIKKILSQEGRRKEFNFAKLKSVNTAVEEPEVEVMEDLDDLDEENGEESMFMAYDIDMDDMEDNIEGDLD